MNAYSYYILLSAAVISSYISASEKKRKELPPIAHVGWTTNLRGNNSLVGCLLAHELTGTRRQRARFSKTEVFIKNNQQENSYENLGTILECRFQSDPHSHYKQIERFIEQENSIVYCPNALKGSHPFTQKEYRRDALIVNSRNVQDCAQLQEAFDDMNRKKQLELYKKINHFID